MKVWLLRNSGWLVGDVGSYLVTVWFTKALRTLSLPLIIIGWYEIYCSFNCFNWIQDDLIYCETESGSYLRYGFMIQHAHICPLNYPCMQHFSLVFHFFLFSLLFSCTHLFFSPLSSCALVQFLLLLLLTVKSVSLSYSIFFLFLSTRFSPNDLFSLGATGA